ncbi:hypothetical protein A6U86_16315 [Rhizobium sp. AC27/96]|uniref:DUF6678 family protein n=1 Tax=Rhizobium sp. AC27/96 TaxID=1841653 RepID=UPI0008287069|nr:DUF6678 family protein [Rhizobium sp. AC27/96]OCI95723.1 hypothetical protein A6U86_16315 [Rhizobium sp. AC27/96]
MVRIKEPAVDMNALRLSAKKEVARNYSASLMSNTKWRLLFKALEASDADIKGIAVKFIGANQEWSPVLPSLYPPYVYVDLWPLNVYPLVEIEWIEFRRVVVKKRPKNVPSELVPQDINAIRAVIEATGKHFPIEDTEQGFKVIGHLK